MSVLSRIARELDDASLRLNLLRQDIPQGPSITDQVVSASYRLKTAAGNLKLLAVNR